jgi:hypothetical protein
LLATGKVLNKCLFGVIENPRHCVKNDEVASVMVLVFEMFKTMKNRNVNRLAEAQ